MSRYYRVDVETKDATQEELLKVMVEQLGWEENEDIDEFKGIVYFSGEGNLTGGMSEEEAHEEIIGWIKTITKNPTATAITKWYCLEDIPYNTYGELRFNCSECGVTITLDEEIADNKCCQCEEL